MALAREDGRQTLAPDFLKGGENADLVVDEDIVPGRVAQLDVLELLLLVDVDQHAAVDSVVQPGALDLARLEHHVAVAEDHGRPPCGQPLDDVERAWIEAVRERVVQQERREHEHVGIARVLDPVALQRAQVVGVAELGAQRLEDRPVALLQHGPDRAREVTLEIGGDPIVVEQRVVDVEQEHDPISIRHVGGRPAGAFEAPFRLGSGGGSGLRGSRSGRVAAL